MPLVATGSVSTGFQGVLAPRVGPGSFSANGAPNLTDEQAQVLTQKMFNTKYNENAGISWYRGLAETAAASAIDLGDTVGSSLADLVPGGRVIRDATGLGIKRGDIWNMVGQYGGSLGNELTDYYGRNQSRIELISGVTGAIGTGYLAGELLLPKIADSLANSTIISGSKLWQYGARVNALTRSNAILAQEETAATGEAYSMWRNPAGRSALYLAGAKGAGKALFEETAIGLTMHTNQGVWSDDMSTNLMFGAFGVGLGSVVAGLGARAEVRALANDPHMVNLREDAIDPQGFTSLREDTPLPAALAMMKNVEAKESANFTSLMLESRQAIPATADPKIMSRFEGLRRQTEEQATNSLQKISTKGVEGVGGTRFNIDVKDAGSAGQHVMAAAHDDPLMGFGLASMGVWKPAVAGQAETPLNSILTNFKDYIDSLKKPNKQGLVKAGNLRKASQLSKQQALVLVDGSWLPADAAASDFSLYQPGRLQLKLTTRGTSEFVFRTESGKPVRVLEDFNPRLGQNQAFSFDQLPIVDRLEVTEAMNHVFDSMLSKGTLHVVPARPNWFQLDAAVEFNKRGGSVTWGNAGLTGPADARLMSLRLKAAQLRTMKLGTYWDRHAWNLPLPSTAERIYDANGDSMRVLLQAADQGAQLDAIQSLREQIGTMNGFKFRTKIDQLDGDIFNFNKEGKKWKTPVVGMFDSRIVNKPLAPIQIAQANAEVKASRINTLVQPKRGLPTLVPSLTTGVVGMPDFQVSLSLRGLADDQVTGLGNAATQLAGELVTAEFRRRDNPVLLGLSRVRKFVNTMADAYLHDITVPLATLQKQLSAAAAAPSKTLVNQFFSNASGWDILGPVPIAGKPGFWGFELAETQHNGARLGGIPKKGQLLANPRTNAPIVADTLALSFIDEFNSQAVRILNDKNRLRVARGLPEIAKKKYYVPPPDTRGKWVGFTFDEEGRTVSGGGIVASTEAEFERLRGLKLKDLAKNHPGYTFATRKSIEDTADFFDRNAMDWIDPGVGYSPAKTQYGSLASEFVNPHALEDTLGWMKRQVEEIGTNTMRVLYDSNLGIARARGAVERGVRSIAAGVPTRTIWDEYEAIALGRNLADSDRSISGPVMKAVESRINYGIAAAWPAMKWMSPAHLTDWVRDAASRMGVPGIPSHVKTFDQLVTHLGPYSPYATLADFAEQNFKVVRPPEIRGIAQQINRMSAALVLRYFELPMAAMNMLGVITTLPSILQSGKAPVSTVLRSGGKRYGVVDGMKILAGSFNDMLHSSRHPDWNFMVKNGDTTQQVAEFNKQLSTITDRGSFKRVFLGDKTIPAKNITQWRSAQDMTDAIKNKGVDGLISILTDTTENWSRTWSHFAGLRLADLQGITGLEARHSFAREVANAAIANYDPMNRPELFQSAFGSMFGLFASYMQSYNQRLFRWMETGDYASVGRQLGMQASLFGLASLPGFNAVQSILLASGIGKTESGEEATLLDNLYAKLGPTVGSAFAHGGLSELGVALYTRGDMNYRDVTLNPTRLMAGIGVMANVATAVQEAAQTLFDPNSIDGNARLMEILARNMPNRVLKGIMTQVANGGQDTDATGQIISENRSFFESALRMAGLRSTFQQGRIEAFYANKQLQDREAARMDVLRVETRALIRNAPDWQSKIQELFDKYLSNGGRPEHFRTWIKDQVRASTSTRDMNDLVKAFRNPKSQLEVWRYQNYAPD